MPTEDAGPGFRVREARWQDDAVALGQIRQAVFVREQGVPLELEWDGRDSEAWQVLALDASGTPIGCGRLLPDGQIGRMAVLSRWRGHGVGTALLQQLLELGRRELPSTALFLHAQCAAERFYVRHGFRPRGEVFQEAGIPHRHMVLEADHD